MRDRLPPERFSRLLAALTLATGIEALVALRDISGLSADEAGDIITWTVRTLVRAKLTALDQAGGALPTP